jgi:DNA ligase-1
MSEKLCLLAKEYEGQDPTGWWMSEKLDGIRALWDGVQFKSRNGNVFNAPGHFTQFMPNVLLDGELFLGYGKFDKTSSIVRSKSEDKGWKRLTYKVFDFWSPDVTQPFEKRYDVLSYCTWPWPIVPVEQTLCRGHEHLLRYADNVHARGGEGVMLRKPGSLYECKRSSTLLKVKRWKDVDARVVGYVAGKGKHKGCMGALDVDYKHPSGRAIPFQVGSGFTDLQRENPPAIGSTIVVKYQELTKDDVPRFPVYIGQRADQ